MSFQAYLDNVHAKTGKTAEDFKRIAKKNGLATHRDILTWLKGEYELGHGHATAIAHFILQADKPETSTEEDIARHFSGAKAVWRKAYNELIRQIKHFAPDVQIEPTNTYISLLHANKKFAIVQVTAHRLDIGIKRKGIQPEERFIKSGTWNAMVTHRAQITDQNQIDAELITWLTEAYTNA